MEQANTDNPTPRRPQRPMRPLLIAAAVVLALLVGGLVFFAVRAGRAASAAQAQNEQLLLSRLRRVSISFRRRFISDALRRSLSLTK